MGTVYTKLLANTEPYLVSYVYMKKSEGGPKVLSGEKKETPQFDRFRKYFNRSFAPTKSQLLPLTDQKVILGVIMLCARAGIKPSALTFLNSCPGVTLAGGDAIINQTLKVNIPDSFCDTLLSHGIDSAPTLTDGEKEYLKSAILHAHEVVARRPKKQKQDTKLTEASPTVNKQAALRAFGNNALANMIVEYGGKISDAFVEALSRELSVDLLRADVHSHVFATSSDINDFLARYASNGPEAVQVRTQTYAARSGKKNIPLRVTLKERLADIIVTDKYEKLCDELVEYCNNMKLHPDKKREQHTYPDMPWVFVIVRKGIRDTQENFSIVIDLATARAGGKEAEAYELMKALEEKPESMFTRFGNITLRDGIALVGRGINVP